MHATTFPIFGGHTIIKIFDSAVSPKIAVYALMPNMGALYFPAINPHRA